MLASEVMTSERRETIENHEVPSFNLDGAGTVDETQYGLSPMCNSIKLNQRDMPSRTSKFEEQKRTNKSRTGYTVSNLSQKVS